MRSNYWGQGAHNALLVVGDFYRHALDARLIDPALRFDVPESGGRRPGPNVFDRLLDWLGGERRRPAASPAPDRSSRSAAPEAGLDRITEQLREDERNRERQAAPARGAE